MEKRWNIKDSCNPTIVDNLTQELGIDPVLVKLLVQRGITTFDEAKAFFRPQLSDLHNPFLMKDMDRAVERLEIAIANNERILIYGDYDVDGTTSVALVYSFLSSHYKNIDYYIPNRYDEGYGVSFKGIDYAKETGCSLIIALDCGIKSVDKVDYANNLEIDFIICDHHTPGESLPKAVACLDSKRADCNYPDKNLSGCGVGFKLMQALCMQLDYDLEGLFEFLDLVAVSIASDIVPIIGENRVLAYYGLQKLNRDPSLGLKSIIDIAGLKTKEELNITDIVFKIGPRINAAGRIESGRDAVSLLISCDQIDANTLSNTINTCNETRRKLDKDITCEALKLLEEAEKNQKRFSTVIYNETWNKGVIGIVASRLTEFYYRPTVVLTESNGFATGSARSVEGFDLYKAIEHCNDLLESFGGHTYAAGLTLKLENIGEFSKRFEAYVASHITPEQLIPQIDVDAVISLAKIDEKFYKILKQFEPFGPGNMKPTFVSGYVFDSGASKTVGKPDEDNRPRHLKVELMENNSSCIKQGIGFSMEEKLSLLKAKEPVDVCYSIEENHFNGKTTLQMQLRDIKVSSK